MCTANSYEPNTRSVGAIAALSDGETEDEECANTSGRERQPSLATESGENGCDHSLLPLTCTHIRRSRDEDGDNDDVDGMTTAVDVAAAAAELNGGAEYSISLRKQERRQTRT